MAKYGLLLKDGNPNRLAEAEERVPAPHMSVIDGSPDEIRQACAKSLTKIAMRMLSAGTALLNQSARVTAGLGAAPNLRRQVTARVPCHEEIARIIAPLCEVERRERVESGSAKKRTGRPRDADRPAVVREGTVIRGAFGNGRAA